MSLSTSDAQLIVYLEYTISQINFYFGILIFVFGIVGNILNILILSQRTLRSNTCIIIFLVSSITGIITILSGLTSRILSNWNLDISDTQRGICKFRGFLLYTFRFVTFWLIMLATIDRWLISSPKAHFRQLSTTKNVFRSIFLIIFLSMIIHCQILYCYESNLINTPLQCFNKDSQCRLINDLIFAIITILLPIILISIFGWMTILNIRSSHGRIEPTTVILPTTNNNHHHHPQRRFKRTDQYLFSILFIQVILLAFLTLPLTIQKLYATLTLNINKSSLQITIEGFIYQITLIMTYLATGMQFYVNTLSGGSVFRKAIIELQQSIIRIIMCR